MKKLFTLIAAALLSSVSAFAAETGSYTITFNDGTSTSNTLIRPTTTTYPVSKYVTAESANYIESFAYYSTNTSTRCYLNSGWSGAKIGNGSYDGSLTVNLSEKGKAKASSVTVNGSGTVYLTFYDSNENASTLTFKCGSSTTYKSVTVNFTKTVGGVETATTKKLKYFEVTTDWGDHPFIKSITVNYEKTAATLNETSDETSTTAWNSSLTYDITCNRSMTAGKWNTLMLPFPMTSSEVKSAFGETAKVMKMASIENGVVNFETATTIARGEAYIVNPDADVTSFTVNCVNGMTSSYQKSASKSFGDWAATSNFYQFDLTDYTAPTYILSDNKFYYLDAELTGIKGFRWYLVNNAPNAAKTAPMISFDGAMPTSIDALNAAPAAAKAEGKFVKNGQLVIVKNGKQYNAAGAQVK